MGFLDVGSAELGLLVLLWVAAGVGAAVRWPFRQVCVGASLVPVVAFAVITWPLGPIAIVVGGLFFKYRAQVKRVMKRFRDNRPTDQPAP